MLEGLEISEILKSNLERTLRIDSEFYSKENLRIIEIISKHKLNDITQLVKVSDGNHMAISDNFLETGIPYYRGQNIHNYFIEESNPICIDLKTFNLPVMKRSHLKEGDVLLSIVGTIGGVALVSSNENATCNCKLAIFRPENTDGFFLSAFLKSKYGQNQIKKFIRGTVQMGLILEDMNQIMVPVFSNSFQKQVRKLIQTAKEKSHLTKQTYANAETLLLQEIDLEYFEPSKESINIKSFKESFGTSGRLDAEYYQKKYEDYLSLIYTYKYGFEKLTLACNLKDSNFNPNDETQYKYIELSNIGKSGEVNGSIEEIGYNLPSRARRLVNSGDVVISSIEGSLQSCGLISKEYNNSLCSTGFYVINSDKINSETLLVLFKSELMQAIMKQNCSGTILTAMNKDDFSNIPVPIIDYKKQEQIAELVEESFKLKVQSEKLLEVAKKAVEMAIEESEEKAINFIHENNINK